MGKSTTKDRSRQVRIYDADGYRKRADAIIFKDKTFTQVQTHLMYVPVYAHILHHLYSVVWEGVRIVTNKEYGSHT